MSFSRHGLLRVLAHVSRFGLAAMFAVAVVAKLWTLGEFARNVGELVGRDYAWFVAVGVVIAEALAVVLLVLPRAARFGAMWSAVLLVGFAAYALYYVYVLGGEPLECGCFGRLVADQLGVKTALRNLALLIPAVIVFFVMPRLEKQTSNSTSNL